MTICPIAIAVSCEKCPVFKLCPGKSIIGDYPAEDDSGIEHSNSKEKKEKNS